MATKNGRVLATEAADEDYVEGYDSGANRKVLIPMDVLKEGQVGGWKDLKAALVGSAKGSGVPALAAFGPTGNVKQMAFAIGDSVYISVHVEHDIKLPSTMYSHVHWSTNGVDVNTVKWQLSCVNAMGHDQDNFPADVVLTVEEAAAGTAWRHMISEDVTGFAALEPDSLVIMELKRITNGGTDNTDTVFALYSDIHYETDRYATPSRTPDFYTA